MKLLRYRKNSSVKPGILDDEGNIREASSIVHDWTSQTVNISNLSKLNEINTTDLPIVNDTVSIAPCLGEVGKFVCAGLNYSDHAAETGMAVPKEPIIFMKATSSICGANDNIIIPKNSTKTDWEVELGAIIGKEARYISEQDSQDYVAGYCVVNDLSEREFQMEHMGQWVKANHVILSGLSVLIL